jgi:putative hemolysin
MSLSLHIILLIFALGFSAFFSGSESALFSLSEYEKERFKEKNRKLWERLSKFLAGPTETISLIITGNTIANTVATSILGILIYLAIPNIPLIASILLVTSIILIIGEVIPKLLALRFSLRLSKFSLTLLPFISSLLYPIEKLLSGIAMRILGFFGIESKEFQPQMALSELYAIVKAGEEKGLIEKEERIMAERVLDFGKRWVREIMTPRVEIVACDYNFKYEEIIKLIKEERHTKYPVYKGDIDNVIGILYARELLFKEVEDWRELIRPLLVVPESMNIDELLLQFRERDEEIALVVDEYGGTAGIVTLEDILEEIVGEIEDEYRKEKRKVEKVDKDTYSASGDISLRELSDLLNVDLKVEGITTLAGLLMHLFHKIPSSGQSIEYKGLRFFIEEVSKNRIKKVTIKKGK